jgi:hypothetical protein
MREQLFSWPKTLKKCPKDSKIAESLFTGEIIQVHNPLRPISHSKAQKI